MLRIKTMENGVTVKCLVRHPALHTQPLLDFVRIRQNCEYNSVYLTHFLQLKFWWLKSYMDIYTISI